MEKILPHWYKRQPISIDHQESETRIAARNKLYEALRRAQQNQYHHLIQNIEHIYDEVDDSENIIINPLIILANPELATLLEDAGFHIVTKMPQSEQRRIEAGAEFKERLLKGSDMNKKEM